MYQFFALSALFTITTTPLFAHAQSFQQFFVGVLNLLSLFVLPLLMGLAVLFFIYNVIRFFILGSDEPEGRANARNLALYGILTFVILVSFWGVVWFLISGFGFNSMGMINSITPDYIQP